MTRPTFDDALAWLQRYHTRTLSPEAVELYWREFADMPDAAFAKAVEESCRKTSPGRFPTIGELRTTVVEHKEAAWQRGKGRDPRAPLSNPLGSEKVKELVRLLEHRMAKKITQQELEESVKRVDSQ